jgi:hypothetical protein
MEWKKAIRNPDLCSNIDVLQRLHLPAFGNLPFDRNSFVC